MVEDKFHHLIQFNLTFQFNLENKLHPKIIEFIRTKKTSRFLKKIFENGLSLFGAKVLILDNNIPTIVDI